MRVSIVPEDGSVIKDGVGYVGIDLSFIDPSVHAVQWYGEEGEIERQDERGRIIANEVITSMELFQPALDAWQVVHDSAQNNVPE
jgi:hypothetical protein